MANEIQIQSATGRTVYAVIFRDSDQQVYNGSGFEALDGDNWGDYDVALTEVGTTGIYRGTFPVVASANYSVLIYWQQAGSPATSDVLIGIQPVAWSGTAVASLLASQVVGKVAATLAAADVSGNLPARLADSVTHGGTSAVLSISNLLITTTGSTNAIEITGSGSGDGLAFTRSGSGDVFDANFEAAFEAFAAAGAVTAIGSENVVTTANLPANFASLLITSDGYISRVVLVDTTTTNTDMRGTNNALLASNYTAPDNAGITTAAAQATAANSTLTTLTENVSGLRFTEKALEEAPSGGGSGGLTPEQEAQLDFIEGKVSILNGGSILTSASVVEGGKRVVTVRGDSYTTTSPRGPLEWEPENDDADWPDLTDATVTFTSRRRADDVLELTASGSVINPAGPGKKIRVSLTASQTNQLTPGVPGAKPSDGGNKFDVQVVLSNGTIWTPIRGGDNLRGGGHVIVEDQTR